MPLWYPDMWSLCVWYSSRNYQSATTKWYITVYHIKSYMIVLLVSKYHTQQNIKKKKHPNKGSHFTFFFRVLIWPIKRPTYFPNAPNLHSLFLGVEFVQYKNPLFFKFFKSLLILSPNCSYKILDKNLLIHLSCIDKHIMKVFSTSKPNKGQLWAIVMWDVYLLIYFNM